jgi:hypothetical protein
LKGVHLTLNIFFKIFDGGCAVLEIERIGLGRAGAARVVRISDNRLHLWRKRGLFADEPAQCPYLISEVFSIAALRDLVDFELDVADGIAIANSRAPWRAIVSGEVMLSLGRDAAGRMRAASRSRTPSVFITINTERLFKDVWPRFAEAALDQERTEDARRTLATALFAFRAKIAARIEGVT